MHLVVLLAVTHEIPGVGDVGLGQVDEAVQDEAVAEVLCAVNLHQLVGRPLGEEEFGPVVLYNPVVTGAEVGTPGKTSPDGG